MRKSAPKLDLSQREQQLIAMAGEGLTDTAIANRLGISEATVNTYWGRIRVKLGPHNRTELVALALKDEYERKIAVLRSESADPDYGLILQAAPDAILIVSETGIIEDANVAAAELLGYSQEELEGMDLAALLPQRFRTEHGHHMEGYLQQPERRSMGDHVGATALRKDGTEIQIAAALSSVTWRERPVVICSIRPVA